MSHPRLSPAQAHARLGEGYVYLDVRTAAEFDAGHPTGAVHVALQLPGPNGLVSNPDFVAEVRARCGSDAKLVVGCASGVRSKAACEALLAAGFTEVAEQRAGFDGVRDPFGSLAEPGWRDLGLPVSRRDD